MIIKASQRAGARQLADHLMNDRDNEHVTVHEVRGFVSGDLHGAFDEAHAIAKGTRCEQFLFSVSFNPPMEANATIEDFEKAIIEAEHRLGLDDQPRAIVFHEKEGRRHAHVVWSRIDGEQMKAVNMSHYKRKLNSLAKELYLEHGWELPDGFRDPLLTNPLNFTREEWEQAKRTDRDPREIKHNIYEAYANSDSKKSFEAALQEKGFKLARGDRRGFVAVDYEGEVYSLSRWTKIKVKDLKARLGDPKELPSVDETIETIRRDIKPKYRDYIKEQRQTHKDNWKPLKQEQKRLVWEHNKQRLLLQEKQTQRWNLESQHRANRYRTGIARLVDKISGQARKLRNQNEFEAWEKLKRDQRQTDKLIFDQLRERRHFLKHAKDIRKQHLRERNHLYKLIGTPLAMKDKYTKPFVSYQDREKAKRYAQHMLNRGRAKGRDSPSLER